MSSVVTINSKQELIAGALQSRAFSSEQTAKAELSRLRLVSLRATARKGKDNEWFAAIEEGEGTIVLFSQPVLNRTHAEGLAQAALRAIKA